MSKRDCTTTKKAKLDLRDLCHVNLHFSERKFLEKVRENYADPKKQEKTDGSIIVYDQPFKVCVLHDILSCSADFTTDLVNDLDALSYFQKENDLYKFKQSADLHNECSSYISHIVNLFENEIQKMLCQVTGRALDKTVDVFCSKYGYTDYLLCHDDRLEDRCIAFNYYLNPDWLVTDGGLLDLFSTKNQAPDTIKESILPGNNMLVFFEVSPVSFHQVREVLSETKTRLTISGWYHAVNDFTDVKSESTCSIKLESCMFVEEDLFYKWINPVYLLPKIQNGIKSQFETDSEIELTNFLQSEMYENLVAELRSLADDWSYNGPPDKRNYETLSVKEGTLLCELVNIMKSDAMFLTLSQLSGLTLHPLYQDSDSLPAPSTDTNSSVKTSSCCGMEVCRWSHGSYTLLHDKGPTEHDSALDATLFLGCHGWDAEMGGLITYVAKNENIELLSVSPKNNSLALVYRDNDTMKFVKHLNHKITRYVKHYYTVSATYYE